MSALRKITILILFVGASNLSRGQEGIRDSLAAGKDTTAGPWTGSEGLHERSDSFGPRDSSAGDRQGLIPGGDTLWADPEDSIFLLAGDTLTTSRTDSAGSAYVDSSGLSPAGALIRDSGSLRPAPVPSDESSDAGPERKPPPAQAQRKGTTEEKSGEGTETLLSQDRVTAADLIMRPGADTLAPADSASAVKASRGVPSMKGIFSFSKIFWSLVLILISYLLIRGVTKFLNAIAERSARFRIWLKGLIPLFRIVAWTVVIFIIIQAIFKPTWQTILALSASIGVALGLAAQDILKNLFGGFTILAEKSFQVGDKIQVGEHYGEVISIGFRSTKIRTADDSMVTLPNGELTSRPISNANSGETNCQVVAEFYLPENIDFEKVRKIATEAAQISGFVYLNKPIAVLFSHELKENRSFVRMRLKAYVLDIRYEFALKSQMTETVMNALREEGILPG